MHDLIPAHIKASFEGWAKAPDGVADDAVVKLEQRILTQLRKMPKQANSSQYGVIARQLFSQHFDLSSLALQLDIQRCVLSRLALGLPRILQSERVTEAICNYYPSEFERLANGLDTIHEQEKFVSLTKYTRLLTGLTVPCGVQCLDLRSAIPVSSAVLAVYRMKSLSPLLQYACSGGTGVWYRPHLDSHYLDEFNEEGYDRFYHRVAGLLRLNPQVKGLVATSWFYDPVVTQISPRLAFLRQRLMEQGAFCFRHGSSSFDIENATKTSPTRRKLYEERQYVPTAYSMILPRDRLIAWAEAV